MKRQGLRRNLIQSVGKPAGSTFVDNLGFQWRLNRRAGPIMACSLPQPSLRFLPWRPGQV